jgi:hypothetical protein
MGGVGAAAAGAAPSILTAGFMVERAQLGVGLKCERAMETLEQQRAREVQLVRRRNTSSMAKRRECVCVKRGRCSVLADRSLVTFALTRRSKLCDWEHSRTYPDMSADGAHAREAVRSDILRIPASELPFLALKDRSPPCHQCHLATDYQNVVCCGGVSPQQATTFNARLRLRKLPTCAHIYCFACLAEQYGLVGADLLSAGSRSWMCPACCKLCTCNQCCLLKAEETEPQVKMEDTTTTDLAPPLSPLRLLHSLDRIPNDLEYGEDDEDVQGVAPLWMLPVEKPPRKKSTKRESKPAKAASASSVKVGGGGRASMTSVQDQYQIIAGPQTAADYFPSLDAINARGSLVDIPPVAKLLLIRKLKEDEEEAPSISPAITPAPTAAAIDEA